MNSTVQISPGLRLSDDNARSFVRKMLASLQAYNDKTNQMLEREKRGASLGNPIGQKRFLRRFIEVMGPSALEVGLTPGTRCRFTLTFSLFAAYDHSLAIRTYRLKGMGTRKDIDVQAYDLLEVSEHALVRLIQRSGVREAEDYLLILQGLTLPTMRLALAMLKGDMGDDETWPLPVTINGQRILLLVRRDGHVAVVATVYKGSWRTGKALDELEAGIVAYPKSLSDEELAEAFRKAAKLFRTNGERP